MSRHLRYLWVVLRHKWYVLRFGWGTVPLWRLLVHDVSKFSRAEWGPYSDRFASGRAGKENKALDPQAFKDAWRHHYLNNPHHWEFWTGENTKRSANAHVLWEAYKSAEEIDGIYRHYYDAALNVWAMPETFVHEMVADWKAASRVYSGEGDCLEWYHKTKERQVMHPSTRQRVEQLLGLA